MTRQTTRAHVLVVSLMPQDASTTLFFTALADRLPMRVVEYPGDIARPLSGASAVIFVRGLFECRDVIWCTRRLGIPRYYFLDDNFMLIRNESVTYGRFYERYTDDAVRAMLRDFDGVLLATDSLLHYFREQRLHDRLLLFPPVAAAPAVPTSEPAGKRRPLTIAFFGGVHRREAFVRYVYPAACRLARDIPVRLVAAGFEAARFRPAVGLEIVYPPYERSYRLGLQRLAEYGVDILVHPSTPTANNPYKNRHVLINAYALGAAVIFSNTPPYDALAHTGVAVVCDNTEEAWLAALTQVAVDAGVRRDLRRRLAEYCTSHFSGDSNTGILESLLNAHPSPSARTRRARWAVGMPCLALGRGLRIVGRQFKPA
jgi:glycosyltransferase involved in cell wall biosynthesis